MMMTRTENLTDSFDTDTIKDSTYLNTDTVNDMDTIKEPITSREDDDDSIAMIMQLIALSQIKYKMNRPFDNVQLVVLHQDVQLVILYQDKYHHIAVVSSLDRNGEYSVSKVGFHARNNYSYRMKNHSYRMKLTPTTEDSSSTDNTTEDLIDSNKILNGEYYLVSSKDALTNTTKDMDTIKDMDIIKDRTENLIDSFDMDTTKDSIGSKEDKNDFYDDTRKNGEEKRLEEKYQSRALHSEGQYEDEVYTAEEGMFQEPIPIKDKMKKNGEQTTCYSNQDRCMIQFCRIIIAIDSKDSFDMIATDASVRYNEGKIDIYTNNINDINRNYDETTTLISIEDETTHTSIGDETTTLIRTIQNGEKNDQLDYNLVMVSIYDHVISMIPVQLCLCILLIVTIRLLSQSMGSVKIHKAQVNRASQLNQVSQMRARLKAGLEALVNRTSHESFGSSVRTMIPYLRNGIMSHLGHFPTNRITLERTAQSADVPTVQQETSNKRRVIL